jgi:hypothetical protein
MVIYRFFSDSNLERFEKDFAFLPKLLSKFHGEIDLSIRDESFNLYYKGNSLAKVKFSKNNTYSVSIHNEFIENTFLIYDNRFDGSQLKNYVSFILHPHQLHPFFQKKYLLELMANIKKRNYGEEISFEQAIINDNSVNPDFFVIDRQVTDTLLNRKRIDLLALKRIDDNFRLTVVEVKLGKNEELKNKVVNQLSTYVKHIQTNINDYASCYELQYAQKHLIGLTEFPFNSITIDRSKVEGLIVVGGYSKIAKLYLSNLVKSNPNIQYTQFEFRL